MKHNKLTIVSVFGHNDGSTAIPSIMKSMQELPGSKGLLLSIKKPENLPSKIEWKSIYFLNYKQYSVFMMHALYAYIDTEYCLVVQDDSWVLNGNKFTKEFYEYDYIGPISHCGIRFIEDPHTPTKNKKENLTMDYLYLNYNWVDDYKVCKPNTLVVQNGGFSLRSKRFLEACNVHGFIHSSPDPWVLTNDIGIKREWNFNWNEDIQLTGILRPILENFGYKFATLDVASRFGIEYMDPRWHAGINFDNIVGHHAKSRILLPNNVVSIPNNTHDMQNSTLLEKELLKWFTTKGYDVRVASDWNSSFNTPIKSN